MKCEADFVVLKVGNSEKQQTCISTNGITHTLESTYCDVVKITANIFACYKDDNKSECDLLFLTKEKKVFIKGCKEVRVNSGDVLFKTSNSKSRILLSTGQLFDDEYDSIRLVQCDAFWNPVYLLYKGQKFRVLYNKSKNDNEYKTSPETTQIDIGIPGEYSYSSKIGVISLANEDGGYQLILHNIEEPIERQSPSGKFSGTDCLLFQDGRIFDSILITADCVFLRNDKEACYLYKRTSNDSNLIREFSPDVIVFVDNKQRIYFEDGKECFIYSNGHLSTGGMVDMGDIGTPTANSPKTGVTFENGVGETGMFTLNAAIEGLTLGYPPRQKTRPQ